MTRKEDRLNRASTTLATMLDYLGLNATVKGEEKNGKLMLHTFSDNAGRIIGKKGQSLQGLELLVNRMITKNDIDCPWISIDVDGYTRDGDSGRKTSFPDRRKRGDMDNRRSSRGGDHSETIKRQALDAAKEVKRWGEPVTLKPMNSHDRRIIHTTLKDFEDIETKSGAPDSSGRLKSVIISLGEKN